MDEMIQHLRAPCPRLYSEKFLARTGSPDLLKTGESTLGQHIFAVLRANASAYALVTHVMYSPRIPAVVAVEAILAAEFPNGEAFSNDMKQFIGWRVRQILEEFSCIWIRSGVRVRSSEFKYGSVYELA